ncbi:MAG TPA: fumarylacetoacetate hydrolase family protein [Burkholderiaceae bacterium]|nr:fumarylacetoacetate hydrolase family protein [Burkholderiaceae bacterium]
MKLITYRHAGRIRTGVVVPSGVLDCTERIAMLPPDPGNIDLDPDEMAPGGILRLLQTGSSGMESLREFVRKTAASSFVWQLNELELMAPVPRPGKIIAVGRNYKGHPLETSLTASQTPRLSGVFPSSVSAHRSVVKRPPSVKKLDLEAELAVVIGRHAHEVSEETAYQYVAGYTIVNDLCARELQFDTWPPLATFAKSMNGFFPMGPWMVTADEIRDPQDLMISSWVNGQLMQRGSTSDMLFSIKELISYISQTVSLEPGDIIATGTPAGSGVFREVPQFLQPGDHVRLEISGIGTLEHSIG